LVGSSSTELAPSVSSALEATAGESRADRAILLAVEIRRLAAALAVIACASFVD
jgi:hypothetical protein